MLTQFEWNLVHEQEPRQDWAKQNILHTFGTAQQSTNCRLRWPASAHRGFPIIAAFFNFFRVVFYFLIAGEPKMFVAKEDGC